MTASWNTWCVEGLMPQQSILRDQHTVYKNYVDSDGDFVEIWPQLCKTCTHDMCKFHYNCSYSFLGKNRRHYSLIDFCNIGDKSFLPFELFSAASVDTPGTPVCCHIFSAANVDTPGTPVCCHIFFYKWMKDIGDSVTYFYIWDGLFSYNYQHRYCFFPTWVLFS